MTEIPYSDIEAAQARIERYVRRTPMIRVPKEMLPRVLGTDVHMKLENLQVTGSFKPRGVFNSVLQARRMPKGLTASSGGNHGIAVSYAGQTLGLPVELPVFEGVAQQKIDAMKVLGANAYVAGPTFLESNAVALKNRETLSYMYLHPFASEAGICGQATVGVEVLEDLPDVDLVVVAVGGGGLLAGVASAVKAKRPQARIVGVEPKGANALSQSLAAEERVVLKRTKTLATTLAPPASEQINIDIAKRLVDDMVTVSDEMMLQAARWYWSEFRIGVELAGAAAFAALKEGLIPYTKNTTICCICCGYGTDGVG